MATRKTDKRPDFGRSLGKLFDESSISQEVLIEALKEALAKAFRKQKDIPDLLVRVEITKKGYQVYQQRQVVEEVIDDELEISLADAKKENPDIQLGDLVDELVDLELDENKFDRASAQLAKNVLKQKMREAEKAAIYDEYIDKVEEMVNGIVESVEEKYTLVNLGKTIAMMPRAAQIPGEVYKEGEVINVIVSEVNKETKGAQVLVSRADANLVKRLFEREVPEIYDGIVEIKAIARDAGERTKMAVVSHDANIDPIGSCIGPKGSRVQIVMDEIHGEKIDIFEWSNDYVKLIKNALAPAEILAVINNPDGKGLMVVVPESKLSLAIGRKGKNARLAVKLTNMKIDIKSDTYMQENGIDYEALALTSLPKEEEVVAPVVEEVVVNEEVVVAPEVENTVEEVVATVVKEKAAPAKKPAKAKKSEATEEVKTEKVVKERGVKNTDYVSRFEEFASNNGQIPAETKKPASRKKPAKATGEEDERRMHMNLKDIVYEVKPEYTEEELEEIRQNELENEEWYDDEVDYDEYESYYEDEE